MRENERDLKQRSRDSDVIPVSLLSWAARTRYANSCNDESNVKR
jgi:hypothetical protein